MNQENQAVSEGWPEDQADWPHAVGVVQGGVVPAKPTHTYGKTRAVTQEPFGYFRAEPFGWVDCGEKDEGAVALYDQETVNALQEQRSTFAELAAFHRDARLGALKELAKVEAQRDELLKQRDMLIAVVEQCKGVFEHYVALHLNKQPPDEGKAKHNKMMADLCRGAIARVKGGAV